MKDLLGLSPRPRIVTACAGAGWHLTSQLMATPGASEYLVGSYLPYDSDETASFLGFRPDKFVSEETAIHLATEAFMRATLRSGNADRPIGLGMTASIASLKVHRGGHEAFVAVVSDDLSIVRHVTFVKAVGNEAREEDDKDCRECAQTTLRIALGNFGTVGSFAHDDSALFREVFLSRPLLAPTGRMSSPRAADSLFPGAFNPLHEGHEAIARVVARCTGKRVVYAIEARSPHKARLTFQDMASRAARIRAVGGAVLFTDGLPLYIDKARRFAGRDLVMGIDAFDRMMDPKWGQAIEPMLEEFAALETNLFIAPRIVEGQAVGLWDRRDLIPARFRPMFNGVELPASAASSTQIREASR